MHGMPEEARKGTLNLISSFTPFPPFDSYLLDQFKYSLQRKESQTHYHYSVTVRSLVGVAKAKKTLSASMKYPSASPRRTFVPKLNRCASDSDLVTVSWLPSSGRSFGRRC